MIAEGIQANQATADFLTTQDYQSIVDGRWCSPETLMSLVVDEAPGATLTFIVWLLEAQR